MEEFVQQKDKYDAVEKELREEMRIAGEKSHQAYHDLDEKTSQVRVVARMSLGNQTSRTLSFLSHR